MIDCYARLILRLKTMQILLLFGSERSARTLDKCPARKTRQDTPLALTVTNRTRNPPEQVPFLIVFAPTSTVQRHSSKAQFKGKVQTHSSNAQFKG